MSQATSVQKSVDVKNQRGSRKLSSDAIKKLEIEYFKKRRELEREVRVKASASRADKLITAKKLVTQMRKDYAMKDAQIAKRIDLSQ